MVGRLNFRNIPLSGLSRSFLHYVRLPALIGISKREGMDFPTSRGYRNRTLRYLRLANLQFRFSF